MSSELQPIGVIGAGAWGTAGGRVYSTAINILSLEIYYRYGRVLKVK